MPIVDNAWSGLVSVVRLGRGARVRHRTRTPEQRLELWEFEGCPFCRKVREAMSELDLEYLSHPTPRGSNHRKTAPVNHGRKTYPQLVDPNTDTSMSESEDIIDYLYETYGAGRPPLDRRLAPLNTIGAALASAIRPRGRVARASVADRKQPAEPIVLYSFEACPFSRKVRERLQELNLDVVIKPAAKGSARRAELDGKRTPFLIDPNTGVSMGESDDICRYLEERYGEMPARRN
jgi:glutathione S-transferase